MVIQKQKGNATEGLKCCIPVTLKVYVIIDWSQVLGYETMGVLTCGPLYRGRQHLNIVLRVDLYIFFRCP